MVSLLFVIFYLTITKLFPWMANHIAGATDKPIASLSPLHISLLCLGYWLAFISLGSVQTFALLTMFGIAYIDHKTKLIPDSLQILGTLLAFVLVGGFSAEMYWNLILATTCFLTLAGLGHAYRHVTGNISMGMGDIKLISWLIILGGESMLFVLLAGSAGNVIFILLKSNRAYQQTFAFAPTLIVSASIWMFVRYIFE